MGISLFSGEKLGDYKKNNYVCLMFLFTYCADLIHTPKADEPIFYVGSYKSAPQSLKGISSPERSILENRSDENLSSDADAKQNQNTPSNTPLS